MVGSDAQCLQILQILHSGRPRLFRRPLSKSDLKIIENILPKELFFILVLEPKMLPNSIPK